MKKSLIVLLLLYQFGTYGQDSVHSIWIQKISYERKLKENLEPSVDSAFQIVSTIFSSKEFQDSIRNLTFATNNSCSQCTGSSSGKGADILNTLFRIQRDSLIVFMRKKGGALGKTLPCKNFTIA